MVFVTPSEWYLFESNVRTHTHTPCGMCSHLNRNKYTIYGVLNPNYVINYNCMHIELS